MRRFASVAVVVGAVSMAGYGVYSNARGNMVYGIPFTYGGQQYYVRDGSRRVVYPDRDACLRDVPAAKQSECEPVASYRSGAGSRYYGPVYHPSDTDYRPSGQYPTEVASSANMGKASLPKGSSKYGFGANGKAHTSFKSGGS